MRIAFGGGKRSFAQASIRLASGSCSESCTPGSASTSRWRIGTCSFVLAKCAPLPCAVLPDSAPENTSGAETPASPRLLYVTGVQRVPASFAPLGAAPPHAPRRVVVPDDAALDGGDAEVERASRSLDHE